MAAHIAKTYTCDRCKVEIPQQGGPKNKYPRLTADFSVIGEWAGFQLKWHDLCCDCWTAIHEFLGRPSA